uniref:Uncharacterized protein n=1 Tax=Anguilla anguilla TaxID=7936 RepID=A0A0E9QYD7_ANGAN
MSKKIAFYLSGHLKFKLPEVSNKIYLQFFCCVWARPPHLTSPHSSHCARGASDYWV